MSEPSTIDRRQQRRTRILIAAGALLTVLVIGFIALCAFLDIRSPRDLLTYRAMVQGDLHPIWKDLALRRVRKGDSLEETIRKHPPVSREEVGPFRMLIYARKGASGGLQIIAANGVLIDAFATCRAGEHVFFQSLSQREAFRQAYSDHTRRQILETQVCQIHRAIAAGQDVFISRKIAHREVADSNDSQYNSEMMRQLEEIYGKEYASMLRGTSEELTVEVLEVMCGDLTPGTTLTFSNKDCHPGDLQESETVFLHTRDSRTILSDTKGGELYTTVPGQALTWYRSLTPDQIKDLEARYLAREAGSPN